MKAAPLTTLLFLVLLSASGCVKEVRDVKDVKDIDDNGVSLDTVPYYKKDSLAFDTKAAVRQADEDAMRAIKRRLEESQRKPDVKIFDPWLPPSDVQSEKLTKALRYFPKDKYGYPDWTAAVQRGILKPKGSLNEKSAPAENAPDSLKYGNAEGELTEDAPYEANILFEINDRLMANVVFPHTVHTFWLSCKVCHPAIFKPVKGGNAFTMYDIWEGKYCGHCHGKVAFQPKGYNNCRRCHSSKKKTMGIQ